VHRLTGSWRSDRGAVSTLVAVVLGFGVLLGFGALVIDVGQLYAEREELQSGSDAAALAVAQACALAPATCAAQTGVAEDFADRNAADGTSAVAVLCGAPGTGLAACPPAAGNITACVTDPPASGPWVEVRTSTIMPDGSTLLPPTFARALLGNEDYDGSRVGACARVAWGSPGSATTIAVTLSTCEWDEITAGGTELWPEPDVALPPKSAEGILELHGTSGASTCPAGPSGWDAPGGFGWLDDPTNSCSASVGADGTFGGDTGVGVPSECKDALEDIRDAHAAVLIPVFDGVAGNGANIEYHLSGFSAFVLTGYNLPGLKAKSWLSNKDLCKGDAKCLYGYFVSGLFPATGGFGGTNYGAEVLRLVG
jgi:Flp pilus assembly protein TadG